jgi:hypothetical protein
MPKECRDILQDLLNKKEKLPIYKGVYDLGEVDVYGNPEYHVWGPINGKGPKLKGFIVRKIPDKLLNI